MRTDASGMSQPLLVIDIGNTAVKSGWFDRASRTTRAAARGVSSGEVDDAARWAGCPAPVEIVVGSVVRGAVDRLATAMPTEWPRPRELAATDFGLSLDVSEPNRVGIDRVAAAAAAVCIWQSPCVVIDFGTAVTIDAADDSTFFGGLIAPGPQMLLDAMHARTDALPPLDWNRDVAAAADRSWIGRNTTAAMAIATRGLMTFGIDSLIDRVATELRSRSGRPAVIVRTGGAELPLDRDDIQTVPDLTLRGLALAAI